MKEGEKQWYCAKRNMAISRPGGFFFLKVGVENDVFPVGSYLIYHVRSCSNENGNCRTKGKHAAAMVTEETTR